MAFEWKSVLGAVAPTAATLLGGPLAGLAVEAVGKALGMSDATAHKVKEALATGMLTGEQIAALKQAEMALSAKMKELDIDLERIHADDRNSARRREAEVKDRIPGILAVGVTCGFFGVLSYLLQHQLPESGRDALLVMLGALGGAWGSVVAYYFGSSSGSSAKNNLISQLSRERP